MTSGNEADLEAADYIRYFAEDDETRVIGCFSEQIKTPARFVAACAAAAERQKPIVMLKIGRSEASRRVAAAHTGSLVGADGVVDAALRKLGVTRVSTLDELLETLAVFHARKLPRGRGVAAVFGLGRRRRAALRPGGRLRRDLPAAAGGDRRGAGARSSRSTAASATRWTSRARACSTPRCWAARSTCWPRRRTWT